MAHGCSLDEEVLETEILNNTPIKDESISYRSYKLKKWRESLMEIRRSEVTSVESKAARGLVNAHHPPPFGNPALL